MENARTLFDLGMGTGKIAVQAFLQYKNLHYVFGIELSNGRYRFVVFLALVVMMAVSDLVFLAVCCC